MNAAAHFMLSLFGNTRSGLHVVTRRAELPLTLRQVPPAARGLHPKHSGHALAAHRAGVPVRANRGQATPLAQPRGRQRRRLSTQRFCKQLQSQPTVAFLDGQASTLNRAAHSNVVVARPVVGLGNTQRHGAGGDRRASVHGSKTSKPREFCTVCFDSKRLQYVQSTNAARASHRSWVLYVGHSQVFFAFCATALKRTQSVATCNMCWVCYGTLSGAVLALWRGCFEMRTQPFTTQHVLGMLCCMLKPRHDTHTFQKVPKVSDTPLRRSRLVDCRF